VLEQFKNARLVLIEEQNKLEDLLFDKQRQQNQELAEARRKRREDQKLKLQKFARMMTHKYNNKNTRIQRTETESETEDHRLVHD